MKTGPSTIATGILLAAAGFAFARLLGPKACGACMAHCGEKCRCTSAAAGATRATSRAVGGEVSLTI
jgi:hypothetical protein